MNEVLYHIFHHEVDVYGTYEYVGAREKLAEAQFIIDTFHVRHDGSIVRAPCNARNHWMIIKGHELRKKYRSEPETEIIWFGLAE